MAARRGGACRHVGAPSDCAGRGGQMPRRRARPVPGLLCGLVACRLRGASPRARPVRSGVPPTGSMCGTAGGRTACTVRGATFSSRPGCGRTGPSGSRTVSSQCAPRASHRVSEGAGKPMSGRCPARGIADGHIASTHAFAYMVARLNHGPARAAQAECGSGPRRIAPTRRWANRRGRARAPGAERPASPPVRGAVPPRSGRGAVPSDGTMTSKGRA